MAMLLMGITTSCFKMEEEDIFDQNAAERLESAKQLYINTLTDKGGVWAMEYFANVEEPGYVYMMKFNKNGSVEISADNKWVAEALGSTETLATKTSLWEVITDDGPVLSFNSYNPIFHIFANPEDIPDTDPDEQGYGHEGDYEFDLMKVQNDTLFLSGKKYRMPIIMYRLSSETVPAEYFGKINDIIKSTNITKFPDLLLSAGNGKNYIVNDIATLIPSIYEQGGYKLVDAVTGNTIATDKGFRFITPFELYNSGVEVPSPSGYFVQHFELQEDGSFLCTDDGVSRITSLPMDQIFPLDTYSWEMEANTLGGEFATRFATLAAEVKSGAMRSTLKSFTFMYDSKKKSKSFYYEAGSRKGNFYLEPYTFEGTNNVTFKMTGDKDSNGNVLLKNAASAQSFLDFVFSTSYDIVQENMVNPSRLKLVSKANPENYFFVNVK